MSQQCITTNVRYIMIKLCLYQQVSKKRHSVPIQDIIYVLGVLICPLLVCVCLLRSGQCWQLCGTASVNPVIDVLSVVRV